MSLRLTVLGCGSSAGVPRIGGYWGACDRSNPKNRRRRCSLLVERRGDGGTTRVLIDTSPDLREQLLDAGVGELDAVLYTHDHADHTNGIDELRQVALNMRRLVSVWADEHTAEILLARFGYCFNSPPGSDYPPILKLHRLSAGEPVEVRGAGGTIAALPFELHHGKVRALGFRINGAAYTPDLNDIPDESLEALSGLDLWIVDALRATPHPTHFSVDDALEWVERLKPGRAVLTNMHIDLDYAALAERLPPNVEPAYDGMTLEIAGGDLGKAVAIRDHMKVSS